MRKPRTSDVPRRSKSPEPPSLIARQRLALLRRVERRVRKGQSQGEAARLEGVSVPTLWRWQKQFRALGLAGLEPRFKNSGRISDLTRLRVAKWVLCRIEQIALQQRCSIPAAWRLFAKSPQCSPVLAARIRRGVPPSFLEATRLRTVRVRIGKNTNTRAALAAALNRKTK